MFSYLYQLALQLLESIGTTLASLLPDNNNQQELIPVSFFENSGYGLFLSNF